MPEVLLRRPPVATTELVAVGGVVALLAASLVSPARIEDGAVVCPFRRLTGLPCPACGLTRSWVYLTHAHWGDAVSANPFGYLTAIGAITLLAVVVLNRRRAVPPPDVDGFLKRPWVLAVLLVWLAYGSARIALQLF